MEWSRDLITRCYKCYMHMRSSFCWQCLHTAPQSMPLQVHPLLNSCSDATLRHHPCQHVMLMIHPLTPNSCVTKLYNFVETHMTDAAHHQQRSYNQHVQQRSFEVGDTIWLNVPTAGKLDPKWEGGG